MARKSNSRSAHGAGTIRKKEIIREGKKYTYWEARYTVGHDPGTGKQIQRSITGKTQKEVSQKLKVATASIDAGTYKEPSKMTVKEWMYIWLQDYTGEVKQSSVEVYRSKIETHIIPAFGSVRLESLTPHIIQRFYNNLAAPVEDGGRGLAPATVRGVHAVVRKSLQQAVKNGYIRGNPADVCTLPRMKHREIHPFDENDTKTFLQTIQGHRFESLFEVALFTGMREAELLGLLWDCVNFEKGTILVNKQLTLVRGSKGVYQLVDTKNDKIRTISPAPWVMQILHTVLATQSEQHLAAGELWEDSGLVFTDGFGHNLKISTVQSSFKRVAKKIGRPDARFHDLRHSYAVASIRAGDDIKTISTNLGHASVAFTLDVYAHCTEQMKTASSERMETYITDILKL